MQPRAGELTEKMGRVCVAGLMCLQGRVGEALCCEKRGENSRVLGAVVMLGQEPGVSSVGDFQINRVSCV